MFTILRRWPGGNRSRGVMVNEPKRGRQISQLCGGPEKRTASRLVSGGPGYQQRNGALSGRSSGRCDHPDPESAAEIARPCADWANSQGYGVAGGRSRRLIFMPKRRIVGLGEGQAPPSSDTDGGGPTAGADRARQQSEQQSQ